MTVVSINYSRSERVENSFNRRIAWVVCLTIMTCTTFAGAVTLGFGPITVEDTSYSVPIRLIDMEAPVAALNFSLVYDPNVFQPLQTQSGPSAQVANKIMAANITGPGIYTVLVYGVNDKAMPAGDLGWINLERISTAASGSSGFGIADAKAVSPDEQELPVSGDSAQVAWGNPTAPPPEEPDEEPESPTTPTEEEVPASADPETNPGTPDATNDAAPGTTLNVASALADLNLPDAPMVLPRTARNGTSGAPGTTGTAGTSSGNRTAADADGRVRLSTDYGSNNNTTTGPVSAGGNSPQSRTGTNNGTASKADPDTVESINPEASSEDSTRTAQSNDASSPLKMIQTLSYWNILIGGLSTTLFVGLIVFLRQKLIKD